MLRQSLEVADILRDHGVAWRQANAGHVSAIERCRTAEGQADHITIGPMILATADLLFGVDRCRD